MPSCGMSRSRNVRTKPSRQSALASSSGARKDRGKPPRSHSRSASGHADLAQVEAGQVDEADATRERLRRASTSCGEADPSTRNRAAPSRRSTSTRSTSNSSGRRWNSSMTTSPSSASRARSGFSRRARSTGSSRSKNAPGWSWANRPARVVFPHWRGPRRAAAGWTRRASPRRRSAVGRSITPGLYL